MIDGAVVVAASPLLVAAPLLISHDNGVNPPPMMVVNNTKPDGAEAASPPPASATTAQSPAAKPGADTKTKVSDEKQKERKENVSKQDSDVWKDLDSAGGGRKKSGSGSKTRYYEWDHTHNDIEVYDKNGRHLGSMNPQTGEMYKPPVKGRTIDL
jgi:hypothetical protein